MLGIVLLIVLIVVLLGVLPTWPYSSSWGYFPSTSAGALVVAVLILILIGKI